MQSLVDRLYEVEAYRQRLRSKVKAGIDKLIVPRLVLKRFSNYLSASRYTDIRYPGCGKKYQNADAEYSKNLA